MPRPHTQNSPEPSDAFAQTLPEGWCLAPLRDVTTDVPNIRPEHEPDRVFQYADISSIDNKRSRIVSLKSFSGKDAPSRARRPVRSGDVLFSNVRTYLRNVALIERDPAPDVCSTGFTVLRSNGAVLPRYLLRYVLTDDFIDRVSETQTGTHYPATSDRQVLSQSLPLPPLAEQERIIGLLEQLLARVDACRDRLERVPEILNRFRQAVLAAACSGRLTEEWRQSHATRRGVSHQTDLQPWPLPPGWFWTKFKGLIQSIRMGTTVPPSDTPTPFHVLRSSSVRPMFLDLDDVRYLREHESRSASNFLHEDDLLFTRLSGSLSYVANCARVQQLGDRRIQFPDRLFCVRLADAALAPYIELCFANPLLRSYLTISSKSSAGHQRVSMGAITDFPIPVPPPDERARIMTSVRHLIEVVASAEARVATQAASISAIRRSILRRAFCGKLVPTEAELAANETRHYETAEELLARVRCDEIAAVSRRRTRLRPKGVRQ